MEPRELQILVLASLLHDIGKFRQRAEEKTVNENLAQEYCPHDSSYRSTHRHVLHTDWFIENHLPLPMELEGARGSLARMAATHHNPAQGSRAELCIQKGDCLSSGNDRMTGESGGDYKNARMESVFSQVHLRRHNLEGEPRRYVLKALDEIPQKPDFIVLDPPREGVHPKALKKIVEYGVERMIYISCKPTSLARDLDMLMAAGYRVEKWRMVDMFPGTGNVETVVLLTRIK